MTDVLIDPGQIVGGVFRGTLSGLRWAQDTPGSLASGQWVNVQGPNGHPGVGYVLLADSAEDVLNLAVTWRERWTPPGSATPEPAVAEPTTQEGQGDD